MSKARRMAARLVVLLIATGLALAMAELVVGWLGLGGELPAFVDTETYRALCRQGNHPEPADLDPGDFHARNLTGTGGFPVPPGSFAMPKPEGRIRIFAFGGSTTFGLPLTQAAGKDRDLSFPAWLGVRLRRRFPECEIEVINAGSVGQTFEGAVVTALGCLRFEPDLFLFYSGHNEYLPHALLLARARVSSSWVLRAGHPLLRTRLGRLWQNFQAASQERDPSNRRLGTLDFPVVEAMIGESYHTPEEAALIEVGYERLLRLLAERCAEQSVALHVCTLACNLRSYEPSLSWFAGTPAEGDRSLCELGLTRVRQLLASGRLEEARVELESLPRVAQSLAEYRFRRAKLVGRTGDPQAAEQLYREARDLDGVIRRAPTALNEIIRQVGRDLGTLQVIDVEPGFAATPEREAPGEDLFYDHVHPNLEGTQLLVELVEEALAASPLFPASGSDAPAVEAAEDLAALGFHPGMEAAICATQARSYGGLLLLRLYDPTQRLEAARRLVEQVPAQFPAFTQTQVLLGCLEVLAGDLTRGRERLRRFGGARVTEQCRTFVERSRSTAIEQIFAEAGLLTAE